mgnify:CR=1 FL=1
MGLGHPGSKKLHLFYFAAAALYELACVEYWLLVIAGLI